MKVREKHSYVDLTEGKIYNVLETDEYMVKIIEKIIDDVNEAHWSWENKYEVIKEDNMKELTFKEVITNIKEGEVWESLNPKSNIKEVSLQDWGISLVTRSDINAEDVYFGVNNNTKFKLKRKKYSFTEAFKAYEEGKKIESCISTNIYFKGENETDCCIHMNTKSFYYKEIIDFEQFNLEEIRGEWYIDS